MDVGTRLSLWALTKTYNQDAGSFSGPVYKDFKLEKKSIRIEFSFTDNGLKITETAKNNFVIAGADKVFYPATVKIQGNKLVVSSKKVKHPVAVRYAFLNTSVASLFNGTGLPGSSFRTDNWEIETK
ncbi:MAG: hypothetical protein Q7U54_09895 [Bacteroidales bacterium]|nr:hypothetical protein [Bacteroidales bacterium]